MVIKKQNKNPDFKITNMVLNGKIPFDGFLSMEEVNKLVDEGNLCWNVVNQDSSPMLIARIELDGFNKFKKQRTATMTLWHSGSFNLAGVKKRKEAKDCYEKVIKDLTKLVPRIFNEK